MNQGLVICAEQEDHQCVPTGIQTRERNTSTPRTGVAGQIRNSGDVIPIDPVAHPEQD